MGVHESCHNVFSLVTVFILAKPIGDQSRFSVRASTRTAQTGNHGLLCNTKEMSISPPTVFLTSLTFDLSRVVFSTGIRIVPLSPTAQPWCPSAAKATPQR